MSLRDSFLKAGLVKEKDLRKLEQQLRQEQKVAQGNQQRKSVLEAQAREEAERQRLEAEAALIERRREARLREQQTLALMSSRQILRSHQVRFRTGPQKFWFRSPKPPEIWRMDLPERVAYEILCGRMAVAWCDDAQPEAVVVDRDAAERVRAIRPELILFWNEEGADPDPSQRLLPATL